MSEATPENDTPTEAATEPVAEAAPEATFAAATEPTPTDAPTDAPAEVVVPSEAVPTGEHVSFSTEVINVEDRIAEIHAIAVEIKAEYDSLKPVIKTAAEALHVIVEEVKTKGIAGLIPLLMKR